MNNSERGKDLYDYVYANACDSLTIKNLERFEEIFVNMSCDKTNDENMCRYFVYLQRVSEDSPS